MASKATSRILVRYGPSGGTGATEGAQASFGGAMVAVWSCNGLPIVDRLVVIGRRSP